MGIREARERAEQEALHITLLMDDSFTLAQRHYLYEIYNPNGAVWAAAYRSFAKRQRKEQAVASRISQLYSVTQEHLRDAELSVRAEMLSGRAFNISALPDK
jgi:hypothetical protein